MTGDDVFGTQLLSQLRVRRATPDDLATIVALLNADPIEQQRRAQNTSDHPTDYAKCFEVITADPRHHLVVATLNDTIVATAHLVIIPGLSWQAQPKAQLQGVRVAQGYRNRGIGACIIRWAEGQAHDDGCGVLQVMTDKRRRDAHRFYRRHGFIDTHEGLKLTLHRVHT